METTFRGDMTMAVEDDAMNSSNEPRKPVVLSSLERIQRYGIECKVLPLPNCQHVYEPHERANEPQCYFFLLNFSFTIARVPLETAFAFGEANGK